MNLVDGSWIPVVLQDQTFLRVGLGEIFERGHEILDLSLPPAERISVMRLLLSITHAALDGPADDAEWETCFDKIAPAALRYLREHRHQFELFGEGAFLQLPGIVPQKKAPLDKLDPALDVGHNRIVYDHGANPEGRQFSPEWCALKLITTQCISVGGTYPNGTWNGKKIPNKTRHAPALENCFLHTFLRGADLITTIYLNLVTKQDIAGLAPLTWGSPVWEKMPQGWDDPEIQATTRSYLGRLVPVSRGIRLHPGTSQVTLTNGLIYPKFEENRLRDPFATVVAWGKEKTERYLRVHLDKHPWRNLGAILSLNEGSAVVLRHISHLDPFYPVDIWTGGVAASSSSIFDTAEWNFRFGAGALGNAFVSVIQSGIQFAWRGSEALKNALSDYYQDMNFEGFSQGSESPKKIALLNKGLEHYWGHLDTIYKTLIDVAVSQQEAGNSDSSQVPLTLENDWNPLVLKTMYDTYAEMCPHTTPRRLQAFVKGEKKLKLSTKKGSKKGSKNG